MNTMLITVTERTNEIGLRMVVGATKLDIICQFLIESTILTILGGMIGLLITFFLELIISQVAFPVYLPCWAIITSIGVSGLVGLLAGIVPAKMAASLNPIESLQTE